MALDAHYITDGPLESNQDLYFLIYSITPNTRSIFCSITPTEALHLKQRSPRVNPVL